MPAFGFNGFALISQAIILFIILGPIIVGVAFIRGDADRHGQPGWLWALLTLPLSWLAVLAYLVVRAVVATKPGRQA